MYKRPAVIATELDVCKRTILNRIAEIENERERYGDTAVIVDGGLVLVNEYALLDYMKYRTSLKDKIARKYVPEFSAAKWAKACGGGIYEDSEES